jgi:hypothetical protein
MAQKRISIYSSPTLERVINARSRGQDEGGRSRSNIVTAVLDRYDQMILRAMPVLTEPEWHLIFDAMNGTITWDSAQMLSGSALANVQDGIALDELDKKWLVYGTALVAKLGRLEYPAQVALVDACERFWEFSGNISGPADIVGARCVTARCVTKE